MSELTDLLNRFNRKERNLLIRDILGHSPEKGLLLSESFRKRVTDKLKVPLSDEAWWATDYHLDWLAGALTLYARGTDNLEQARPAEQGLAGLIKGTQEDVDLLIVDGQNLFMVEAKAYGTWSNKQANSKIMRFSTLIAYYDKIKNAARPLALHVFQMSLTPPTGLRELPDQWPGKLKQLFHVELVIPNELSVYAVSRCRADRTIDKNGGWWRVVESKRLVMRAHGAE